MCSPTQRILGYWGRTLASASSILPLASWKRKSLEMHNLDSKTLGFEENLKMKWKQGKWLSAWWISVIALGTTVPIKSVLLFLFIDEERWGHNFLLRDVSGSGALYWLLCSSHKLLLNLFLPLVLAIKSQVGTTMVRNKDQEYWC